MSRTLARALASFLIRCYGSGVELAADGHAITPVRGSARRVRDGAMADLTRPRDYPCEAVCLECGGPIRCERFFLCEWVHVARFSLPQQGNPAAGTVG
jgi:hypothetical protein